MISTTISTTKTLAESDWHIIDYCERIIQQCDEVVGRTWAVTSAPTVEAPDDIAWFRSARRHADQTLNAVKAGNPIPPNALAWLNEETDASGPAGHRPFEMRS